MKTKSAALMALVAAASSASPQFVRADAPDITVKDVQVISKLPLGQKASGLKTEASTGSLYSNIDNFGGYGISSGFAGSFSVSGGTNTISGMLLDDLHLDPTAGGGAVSSVAFYISNSNSTAVSVRPRFRFYNPNNGSTNGTTSTQGPGTFITGFSASAPVSIPANTVYGIRFGGFTGFNIDPTATPTIWAGLCLDDNVGTTGATAAQLANMGTGIFNPPTVGSSDPTAFINTTPTDATHSYFGTMNGGSFETSSDPVNIPALNYGWEIVGPNVTAQASTWAIDGSERWEDALNWDPSTVPNSNGTGAIFGSVITSNATITIDAGTDVSVGTMVFDNAHTYTIAGGSIIFGGGSFGGTLTVNQGSHVIDSQLYTGGDSTFSVATGAQIRINNLDDSFTATTKLGGGTLLVNRTQATTLTVQEGTLKLIAGGSLPSTAGTLTIGGTPTLPTAKFDITDNDLIIDNTPLATVQSYVAYARDGGQWDRNGLTTSSAPATGAGVISTRGIGVITGAEYTSVSASNTAFDGVAISAGQVLVKYTYNGDADFNGKIDANDYGHIDGGYQNQHNAGFVFDWFHGDFDYNGVINANDYALIDAAYQSQSGTLRAAINAIETGVMPTGELPTSLQELVDHYNEFGAPYANAFINITVPEPTTISLVGLATAGLIGRRRRRHA